MNRQERRRLRFDTGTTRHFFLLADGAGPDSAGRSVEQLARSISAKHNCFGSVELNEATFASFIKNFGENTYGQEIYLDRNHDIGKGVQGKITKLFARDGMLFAEVEWTDLGIETFKRDGFKYLSIDFTDDYIHPETRKAHGPLLFGAALTPRPFIKNMRPTEGPGRLSLSEGRNVFVPHYLQLTEGADMKDFLKNLRLRLLAKKLSEATIGVMLAQFEATAKALALGDDEAKLKTLADGMEASVPATDPTGTPAVQLSEDAIGKIVAKQLADAQAATAATAQSQETNRKQFRDAIAAEKGLSDTTRETLVEQADNITGSMSADQVKRLADSAIKMGNNMEVRIKRAALGMVQSGQGSAVHIELSGDIGGQVHGLLRESLKLTDAFGRGELRAPEEKDLSPFARKVLREFDRLHGRRLDSEHKMLAGDGSTNIADSNFPVVAQRQVIVELLADLKFLQIVSTVVDPNAQATMQIPYEQRNTSSVLNGGVVYEGQPIPYGGVKQLMDVAYVVPRKIAMLMSNEMMHFARVAQINWEAWGRNIASNARLMRDLICASIANTLQRHTDSFNATAVANEAITAQVNGVRTVFKTAQFPVVRPYQPRNLQGTAVGASETPITMTVAAAPVTEYDGTGTQAAGTYFQFTDVNLGYFRFVDETGAVELLPNATAVVITAYSYATNVQKFDLDNGAVDLDFHLNGLLNAFGDRRSVLSQERFVNANFAITSATLHNTITKARQFEAQSSKAGTALDVQGDLANIKGVPVWGTNQPGVDLGQTRIILGERGTLTYGIAKPFATGTPFEVVHATTRAPTGEKQAYGEEYSTIHVPTPIRNRLTSVIAYSVAARAAV